MTPFKWSPRFIPLQKHRGGVVLGVNVVVVLASSEGSREKRDAGWSNGPCQASTRNHKSNRRKQISFFYPDWKTTSLEDAMNPWYFCYLKYPQEEFWVSPVLS